MRHCQNARGTSRERGRRKIVSDGASVSGGDGADLANDGAGSANGGGCAYGRLPDQLSN